MYLEALKALLLSVVVLSAVGFIFIFVFIPIFTAIFHHYISAFFPLKTGANGKGKGSFSSEDHNVEILEQILKTDPVFSDIVMYRMRIEEYDRKIRKARKKKNKEVIQNTKWSRARNMIYLKGAMELYVQDMPESYDVSEK